MKGLKSYSEYRESDVPWVSRMQRAWATLPGRNAVSPVRREPRITDGVVTAFRDGQVTLRSLRRTDGFTEAIHEIGYQGVRTGDLVIHGMDGFAGAIGVSEADGKMTPVVHLYRAVGGDARYFAYSLREAARAGYIQSLARGIRERSTAFDRATFRSMLLPIPPPSEQRAIADFLDRETAGIDTLIHEQQRLVEMLRERRQAVLTHALGGPAAEVPFVRCMTQQIDYRGMTPTKTEAGVQLVTARNVKAGWIDYDTSQEFVDPNEYSEIMRRGLPRIGDLLFTMEAPLGNIAVVDREDIALAQRVIKWSVNQSIAEPRYLMYAALGDGFQTQLRVRATGSTALGLKASKLPELRIGLPSIEDQRRIVALLDEQTAQTDSLIAETQRFVELSRERRSALIAAAVTGQIDVTEMS